MSDRKRKNLSYAFPGSKGGARQKRINRWILTLVVGLGVAAIVGLLIYLMDRL